LFAGSRPAVTALGRISARPVKPHNCPHSSAHPAAHSKPASPPADAPDRLILNHAQHSRHSNPHSARRTALVSSLGGFPTPAVHARPSLRQRPASENLHKSRHWPRQPVNDLRHLFDGAFGRAPVGRVRARVALRLTCPFACAFSARAIASSTSFSAPVTSSHLTIVTHLPFSRSL
jgi:hypothetical protein